MIINMNEYLEDKQMCIENKKCWLSCIKSLQRLLNVNFDTECKMLGSRLKNSLIKIIFFINYNFSKIQCGKLSFYSTNLTMILRN